MVEFLNLGSGEATVAYSCFACCQIFFIVILFKRNDKKKIFTTFNNILLYYFIHIWLYSCCFCLAIRYVLPFFANAAIFLNIILKCCK